MAVGRLAPMRLALPSCRSGFMLAVMTTMQAIAQKDVPHSHHTRQSHSDHTHGLRQPHRQSSGLSSSSQAPVLQDSPLSSQRQSSDLSSTSPATVLRNSLNSSERPLVVQAKVPATSVETTKPVVVQRRLAENQQGAASAEASATQRSVANETKKGPEQQHQQAKAPVTTDPTAQIASLRAEKDSLHAEKHSLLAEKDALHAEKHDLLAERDAAKSESARLQETIASLRAQIASEAKETSKKDEQISALTAQVSDLQAKDASQGEQISNLKAQIAADDDQQKKLASDVAAKELSLSKANMELDRCKGDNQVLTKEKQRQEEHYQAEITQLNKEISGKELQVNRYHEDLVVSERERAIKIRELMSNHTALKHLRIKHEKEMTDHKALQKEHLKMHEQHRILESKYADPSVQHFLHAKAVKVYSDPGIEGAANKTFTYVLPSLRERYFHGKKLLNESEVAVYSKLNAYVGTEQVEPWLPALSGCLVYGTVIVPFICTVCCLTRVVCKYKALLLFFHVDFLMTALCAGMFAAYTGKEPLAAFAHHDAAVYLFTQVVFAFVFCLYGLLLLMSYCCANGGTREGLYRCLQIVGAAPVAAIYYVHVWTPAMLDEMPRMDALVELMVGKGSAVSQYAWLPYLPVSILFLILLHLERLSWFAVGASSKAKQDENQMSIVMRDDVELASLLPGTVEDDQLTVAKKA